MRLAWITAEPFGKDQSVMPVPAFQAFLLPMLQSIADGAVVDLATVRDRMAALLALTAEEMADPLPSGRGTRFQNRVAWAKAYLQQAGLIAFPRRAQLQITDRGRALLATNPARIDITLLDQYPEFRAFRGVDAAKDAEVSDAAQGTLPETGTPEELLEQAGGRIRAELAADLQVGEYLVAAAVYRRNFIATTFTSNVPFYDTVASNASGDHLRFRSRQSMADRGSFLYRSSPRSPWRAPDKSSGRQCRRPIQTWSASSCGSERLATMPPIYLCGRLCIPSSRKRTGPFSPATMGFVLESRGGSGHRHDASCGKKECGVNFKITT
jgi:hypothetical protein